MKVLWYTNPQDVADLTETLDTYRSLNQVSFDTNIVSTEERVRAELTSGGYDLLFLNTPRRLSDLVDQAGRVGVPVVLLTDSLAYLKRNAGLQGVKVLRAPKRTTHIFDMIQEQAARASVTRN